MSGGLIAAIAWSIVTLGLVIAAWPRGPEREVLSMSPRYLHGLLFLPFSPWRQVAHPALATEPTPSSAPCWS